MARKYTLERDMYTSTIDLWIIFFPCTQKGKKIDGIYRTKTKSRIMMINQNQCQQWQDREQYSQRPTQHLIE